jgi:hypothetical protein
MVRQIELVDDVRIRFPGRGDEFDTGIEVGMLATLMALGNSSIERRVSPACLEQLKPLAKQLGYNLVFEAEADAIAVTLLHKSLRPRLRVVR